MNSLKVKQLSIKEIVTSLMVKLSFELPAGECLTINGPSGLGKSMLLKAIADILPHQGDVYLDGIPAQQYPAPEWRRKVMLVPAESQWWFETVEEHFQEPENIDFQQLGFGKDILQRDIHHLSSGEKQRLSLLRALQYQPEVLLLDEPTANLDKKNTLVVENIVKDFISDCKHAVLWVGHDVEQLQKMSRRMIQLNATTTEEITWA